MTTNSEPQFSRAELRRLWKEQKRSDRYKKSGFLAFDGHLGVKDNSSKYMPHIGNKQKGL